MGPVVGGVAAVFALLAFYVQYRANLFQREESNELRMKILHDGLNDKFFRLQDMFSRYQNSLSVSSGSVEVFSLDMWVKEYYLISGIISLFFDRENMIGVDFDDRIRVHARLISRMTMQVLMRGPHALSVFYDQLQLFYDKKILNERLSKLESQLQNLSIACDLATNADGFRPFIVSVSGPNPEGGGPITIPHYLFKCHVSYFSNSVSVFDQLVLLAFVRMPSEGMENSLYVDILKSILVGPFLFLYGCYLYSDLNTTVQERGLRESLLSNEFDFSWIG